MVGPGVPRHLQRLPGLLDLLWSIVPSTWSSPSGQCAAFSVHFDFNGIWGKGGFNPACGT